MVDNTEVIIVRLCPTGFQNGVLCRTSTDPHPRCWVSWDSHLQVLGFLGLSPQGGWRISGLSPLIARPIQGGATVPVCGFCSVGWGPEGKYFYLRFRETGEPSGGKAIVFALPPGKELPDLPPSGPNSAEDVKGLNALEKLDMTGRAPSLRARIPPHTPIPV